MANLIQSWAGENLTPAQASEQAIGDAERRGAIWYEWYLGFKGTLERGRWAPPCRDTGSQRIWREFLQRFRGGGSKRLGDFTDMILLLLQVLQEPAVQRELAARWDHILVDEAQDLNAVEHQILGLLTSAIERTLNTTQFAEANGKLMELILLSMKTARGNVKTLLHTLNFPSREDSARLGQLVLALEEKVDQVHDRLDQLEETLRAVREELAAAKAARAKE